MKKLDYIDSLRGLAVLGVLAVHCFADKMANFPGSVQHIVTNSARGVQLFYVISAFTLFLSYSKRSSDELNPKVNFYIRRFFRIAPMYYLAIVYYLFQDGVGARYALGEETEITAWNIVSNVFFFHGFNPYWINSLVPGGWSIATEVLFYLMVPALFKYIKDLNRAVTFFLVTILVYLVVSFVLENVIIKHKLVSDIPIWSAYLLFYLPRQLPVFMCGIILFFLINKPKKYWKINARYLFIISLVILGDLATEKRLLLIAFSNDTLFGMAFVLLTYSLSRKRNPILVNSVTQYLGTISYSMYLTHLGVLHWLDKISLSSYLTMIDSRATYLIIKYITLVICTAIVSTIVYKIIEIPFQSLGKRIIDYNENRMLFDTHQSDNSLKGAPDSMNKV